MPRPQRIFRPRQPGITTAVGKYYRGERCETVVLERAARTAAEKAAKRKTRGTRPPRQRTPSQQLKRLERALLKRKTETARARIRVQIAALQDQLA